MASKFLLVLDLYRQPKSQVFKAPMRKILHLEVLSFTKANSLGAEGVARLLDLYRQPKSQVFKAPVRIILHLEVCSFIKTNSLGAEGVAPLLECLPNIHEVLASISNTI